MQEQGSYNFNKEKVYAQAGVITLQKAEIGLNAKAVLLY